MENKFRDWDNDKLVAAVRNAALDGTPAIEVQAATELCDRLVRAEAEARRPAPPTVSIFELARRDAWVAFAAARAQVHNMPGLIGSEADALLAQYERRFASAVERQDGALGVCPNCGKPGRSWARCECQGPTPADVRGPKTTPDARRD